MECTKQIKGVMSTRVCRLSSLSLWTKKHYLHSNKGYSERNSFNLLCQKVAHNAQLLWINDTHAYMRLASDFEQEISKATKSIKHVMGELFTIAKSLYTALCLSLTITLKLLNSTKYASSQLRTIHSIISVLLAKADEDQTAPDLLLCCSPPTPSEPHKVQYLQYGPWIFLGQQILRMCIHGSPERLFIEVLVLVKCAHHQRRLCMAIAG